MAAVAWLFGLDTPEVATARAVDRLLGDDGDDQVLLEQHLDFVVNRSYRQTLLVHSERAQQISRTMDPDRNRGLHVAAWVPPVAARTRLDHSSQEYGADGTTQILVSEPGVKVVLDALNAHWPDVDVAGAARSRPNAAVPCRADPRRRRRVHLQLLARVAASVAPRPPSRSAVGRSNDRDDLVEVAVDLFRQNVIRIDRGDVELADEAEARDVLGEEIDTMPQRLVESEAARGRRPRRLR